MDILKRGIIAFVFFTAALWFISGAMEMNGGAFPRNPSWLFVKGLRDFFTVLAAIVFGVPAIIFVVAYFSAFKTRPEASTPYKTDPVDYRVQQEAYAQQRVMDETLAKEKKQIELEPRKQVTEKHQQQELIRKKSRSAEAANNEALRDF